ncbi:MAG TPA: Type 1 glutamine amidotransferase-like domain-containing protein [Candidatus Limnocylindrales bacterium]
MPGPVALVGAGEFLAPMAEFDRGLLEAIGRPRPRVVILPTASALDGEQTFRTWAEMGVEHFSGLGAEVEPVLVRTAEEGHDAAALQAVGEADLVYLSGGHPRHLLDVLQGSPLGEALSRAHARGATIAGCSAGAMAIVGRTMDVRFVPRLRIPLPFPIRWPAGLALVDGVAVLPHYDAWPEVLAAILALQAPRDAILLGIDEDTAAVGRNGAWQVHGLGRVTVWRGRHRERFRKGDAFRL